MSGFFDRMLGRNNNPNKGSSSTAKDRLKFVLLHERVSITPEKMREMKEEIIQVIAKYVPGIDPDSVDVAIEQTDRYDNKLVAEIPFTKSRGTPAVDIDGNDDLEFTDDDDLEKVDAESVMAEPGTDDIPEFDMTTEDTIPSPSLQINDSENDDANSVDTNADVTDTENDDD